MESLISRLFSARDLGSLQSEAPTPLYYQMYALLKHRILTGMIAYGAQMPTEQQLAVAFSVSRITAKRALDELAGEQLVERRRGKGTHVIHRCEPELAEALLVGVLEKLASLGTKTRVKVLDLGALVPPRDIQLDFDLKSGEKAQRVVRVRCSDDGTPFAYYVSWTPGSAAQFTVQDLEQRLRLDILSEHGIEVHRVDQYLGASVAPDVVASELGMQAGDPVLTLTRRSSAADGALVDILYAHYHPKRFHYHMSISMEDYRC